MKILVAIANYGTKNQHYLSRIISEYKSMSFDIDIVVFSNIPKDLGPHIEVVVGLPSKDPWSLPFAHKRIFAERVKCYDLFIYSEDDTLIKQENINAFLRVTKILPQDKIAGFLRYEEDLDAKKYCSTMNSYYHWQPSSVESVGGYVFAYFTNEHSACYILTRSQLQKAIESGGFLVGPHRERYDLLCTAATDPYTQCGFKKVVCISCIQDFLLHHLPNQYLGKMGLEFDEMNAQIDVLMAINNNKESPSELLPTRTKLNKCECDKRYYDKCKEEIILSVPDDAETILSVGCGWAATEAKLLEKGVHVVGIPLDSVIAVSAKRRGIEILPSDFKEAKKLLVDKKYDCILFDDTLHRFAFPWEILTECVELMENGGCAIITMPNFRYIRSLCEILTNKALRKNRKMFDKIRIHLVTSKIAIKWIKKSGLEVVKVEYNMIDKYMWLVKVLKGGLRTFFSSNMLFIVKKSQD
jgi:2-polyprenyl-3-methyl-5-hydroxy-6-metoxy-1,4-benzoquinol methylase